MAKNTSLHSKRYWLYTPYGFQPHLEEAVLRFTGQFQDPVSGHYLLGNGQRSYNPQLMRFCSSDRLSPFGHGGINSYAYCIGDPVNHVDPSGHAPIKRAQGTHYPARTFTAAGSLTSGVLKLVDIANTYKRAPGGHVPVHKRIQNIAEFWGLAASGFTDSYEVFLPPDMAGRDMVVDVGGFVSSTGFMTVAGIKTHRTLRKYGWAGLNVGAKPLLHAVKEVTLIQPAIDLVSHLYQRAFSRPQSLEPIARTVSDVRLSFLHRASEPPKRRYSV